MERCPRDGSALRWRGLPDLEVRFCAACHGFAIARYDLPALVARVQRGSPWPASSSAAWPVSITEGRAYCECVAARPMKSVKKGPVVVDSCDTCLDVWLDRGEARLFAAVALHEELRRRGRGTAPLSARELAGRAGDVLDVADVIGVVADGADVVEVVVGAGGALVELLGSLGDLG